VGEPERGDVFVFRFPENPKEDYIKRVVGLPGDEVTYRNKTLYINGVEVAESEIGPYAGPSEAGRSMAGAQVKAEKLGEVEHRIMEIPRVWVGHEGTWRVPPGHYFAMGDNRDNSADSRFWGFVPEENLVGKAFVIWMNWDNGIDFRRIGTLIH
jgi:signal peptidase I